MRAKRLTLQQRREIFHALVTTQDMVKSLKLRDTVPILLGAKLR